VAEEQPANRPDQLDMVLELLSGRVMQLLKVKILV
jgi:hypothetical protein